MRPSIFGENLFPVLPGHDPLYGKHTKNLMKTDVRETDSSYKLDIDLSGFKKDAEAAVRVHLDYH